MIKPVPMEERLQEYSTAPIIVAVNKIDVRTHSKANILTS